MRPKTFHPVETLEYSNVIMYRQEKSFCPEKKNRFHFSVAGNSIEKPPRREKKSLIDSTKLHLYLSL